MKILYLIVILFSVSVSTGSAQGNNGEIEFLYDFLQGTYNLIGKLPDSNQTYAGKVIMEKKGNQLEVIRKISGKIIKGVAKIETATADRKKVLRVRFVEGNKTYEATYLINSDLDNYGRLTGYLYLKKGGTKIPGLEALFIYHQRRGKKSISQKKH